MFWALAMVVPGANLGSRSGRGSFCSHGGGGGLSDKGMGRRFDFSVTTNVSLTGSGQVYRSRGLGEELGHTGSGAHF
jgi:hypothetical protein